MRMPFSLPEDSRRWFSVAAVLSNIFVITAVAVVIWSCDLRAFDNPVDPDSSNYQGIPSVDEDGDGLGRYVDVDEIVPVSPEDEDAVTSLPVVLKCYRFDPDLVSRYYYQISSDEANFTDHIVLENGSADGYIYEAEIPDITNHATYYWRAKAWDGSKWSDRWSEIWSFTVDITIDVTTTLLEPMNGATVYDPTPYLDWEDVEDAVSYMVQISRTESFDDPPVEEAEELTSSEYTVHSPLAVGNTYYWRARVVKDDLDLGTVSGVWSDTVSFTTGD